MENEKELVIEQLRDGRKLTCKLTGWLDPNTSPDLIDKIDLTEMWQNDVAPWAIWQKGK